MTPLSGEASRHRLLWVVLLALLCGLAGIGPHVVFSLRGSESTLHFFKSAFDEEFYFQTALEGAYLRNRLLGVAALRSLYFLTGHDQHLTMVAMDLVFPMLAALAAGLLALRLASHTAPTLLLVLGLLFGQELLSLGSSAVWDARALPTLRELIPMGQTLVPDYSTSYVSFFRTPEPQVSLSVFFLHLALLLRCFCTGRSPTRTDWILLGALHVAVPASYFFFAAPVLILEGFFALFMLASGRRREGLALVALATAGAAWSSALGWLLSETSAPTSVFAFRSTLPVLSPSVLLALLLLGAALATRRPRVPPSPAFLLSLAAGTTVAALMNQQLLTGFMISTRDWERSVNYPLLIFGVALARANGGGRSWTPTFPMSGIPATLTVMAAALGLLAWTQVRTYQAWRHSNELVLGMDRCLDSIQGRGPGRLRVVTEDATLVPLLEFWRKDDVSFVINFNAHSRYPIEDLPETGDQRIGTDTYRAQLLESFARRGLGAEEVRSLLKAEATGGGFYSGFLFSRKDYWPPASDNRAVRADRVSAGLEAVASDYERYLATRPDNWRETTVYLTTAAPGVLRPNPWFLLRPVETCPIPGGAGVRVRAYLQTPRT